MGYCSGMAFRRVGKALGVVIGIGFIGVQTAASMGYINVDWNKIRDDAIKPLDAVRDVIVNHESDSFPLWYRPDLPRVFPSLFFFNLLDWRLLQNADGKVDADDVEIWWQKSQSVLKDSVPGAGGFSAGFLLGARRG